MLEKFGGNDRDDRNLRDRNLTDTDRQRLVRERMEAHGIGEDEALRLVLNEEQLAVGKREVEAGEVGVRKHVETEHVHQNVPLRHDEVEVERRPITDGYTAAGTGATIGQGEDIRIPLHAEEAVVEKRVVPKEELVVRKREVVETENVDATLRRERAEVDRDTTHLRDDRLDDDRPGRV
ncbi:MAG: YsnF/AvaK domain-containing protein [Gemmatimonadetes bacterium]|nr:YsnF/AvaK domain-containing protein [Gemmatimonadota bacterium]